VVELVDEGLVPLGLDQARDVDAGEDRALGLLAAV
jgi:hypothetical protein